jgi:hypothetical protein
MIDEKIVHEPDPGTVLLDPATIIPEKLFTSIPGTVVLSELIKYTSQDTEQSLRPFKIDQIQLEEDGTTNVYYSIFHSSVPTELENRTANAVGSINMRIYDETEAEKLIFETVINKGWYS